QAAKHLPGRYERLLEEVGQTGVAALLDRNGALLAVSNDTPVTTRDGDRIAAADAADWRLAEAAQRLGEGHVVEDRHAEMLIAGEPHLTLASSIGGGVGLDWTLLTVIPERDFTAAIDAGFRRSSIASAVAVALAAAVGVLAARWLVAPLLTIVRGVRRIGQGDLDTEVAIRHAPEYEGLASEINEMTAGLRDRMRMRESLSLAMEVQRNLLPSDSPSVRGLDIAGHSTYCDETGGDYYDFLDVSDADENAAVVAIGDVMGHGVAAAMLMATARGILRSRASVPGSLADFLDHLNEMLVADTQGMRFMTMQLMTIDATRREIRWASAGHGAPIVYDAATDSFPEYEGWGLPLGIMAGESYREHVERGLAPGSIILAATDGLWETKGEDKSLFGMDRLRDLLRTNAKRSSAEISEAIRDALAEHRGAAAQDDDLTFVVIRVE
ncbi:MAG: PP2C family protein-serine/threonine phosphatase, partial [Kiloniellales bacterium]